MDTNLVAVDLAKRWFQVCCLDAEGKVLKNGKLTRRKFTAFLLQLAPTTVAMEACASAHYWGRWLRARGHRVLLVPPQHAKAFRRVHKSDGHDALSIAEATRRPGIHFVPIKSVEQQDLQLLGRIRERLSAQRTGLVNQVRGLAREYGVEFAKHRRRLMHELPEALADGDNGLSFVAREALHDLLADLRALDERLEALMRRIETLARQHPAYERLRSVPGVGNLVAAALLASLGDGSQFRSGRQCAAWLGLIPRQHGTGGRVQLGGITKNGDRSLRTLLIHGARAVLRWADRHTHAQSRWVLELVARRGRNRATVALANKIARIVWAVLRTDADYDMRKAFRPQPAR